MQIHIHIHIHRHEDNKADIQAVINALGATKLRIDAKKKQLADAVASVQIKKV